jgi:hypothetical protein
MIKNVMVRLDGTRAGGRIRRHVVGPFLHVLPLLRWRGTPCCRGEVGLEAPAQLFRIRPDDRPRRREKCGHGNEGGSG